MSVIVSSDQVGCVKERKAIPLPDAIEIFDDKCSPLECPNYHTCESYKDRVQMVACTNYTTKGGFPKHEDNVNVNPCKPTSATLKSCDGCDLQFQAVEDGQENP